MVAIDSAINVKARESSVTLKMVTPPDNHSQGPWITVKIVMPSAKAKTAPAPATTYGRVDAAPRRHATAAPATTKTSAVTPGNRLSLASGRKWLQNHASGCTCPHEDAWPAKNRISPSVLANPNAL